MVGCAYAGFSEEKTKIRMLSIDHIEGSFRTSATHIWPPKTGSFLRKGSLHELHEPSQFSNRKMSLNRRTCMGARRCLHMKDIVWLRVACALGTPRSRTSWGGGNRSRPCLLSMRDLSTSLERAP